jgi:transcriptional regulator GlxA family with amidase domain
MNGPKPTPIDVTIVAVPETAGSALYSACSGAVMLAETGLLDQCEATSHWGYQDLFRKYYPNVRFGPEPNLAFADPSGQIVTAGGTTSWHDLAIHMQEANRTGCIDRQNLTVDC